MKKIFLFVTVLFFTAAIYSESECRELKVLTSYNYIANLVSIIGGDKISVDYMAKPSADPHHIVAKPSLIAKTRKADLLIISGAQLEIGWMPPMIRDSNNPAIQPGQNGFLDLSSSIKKIEVPASVSREQGDVHPDGNPHFYLDPYNIKIIANSIANKLASLDNGNASFYRQNAKKFLESWEKKLRIWEAAMAKVKGMKVIQYHKLYDYFFQRFGLDCVIEMEPLPGIPPTGKHLEKVIETAKKENVKLLVLAVYQPYKVAERIADKTGIKIILLPTDVESMPQTGDIFALFDEMVKRVSQ